jgi:hypothetical protein
MDEHDALSWILYIWTPIRTAPAEVAASSALIDYIRLLLLSEGSYSLS